MKAAAPNADRLDALANRLQAEGRSGDLEAELGRFDPKSLQGVEKESWYHLRGIAAFQRNDRPLAFGRFQEGVEACPDSAKLVFSLAQEHEARGEIDAMIEGFDRAKFPKIFARYALAAARYAYLWDRPDKGREYVEPFFPIYFQLKILDTTFLHTRGLPFFDQAWAYLAAFSVLEDEFGALGEITERAAKECSDFDAAGVRRELAALRTGNYTEIKAHLHEQIEEHKRKGLPTGYWAMRLAVLTAQEGDDPVAGSAILNRVALGPNDFKWLTDLRVLAKGDLARRAGDAVLEFHYQQECFKKQPLLFEPDHSVNFHLLDVQEAWKETYRASHRRT